MGEAKRRQLEVQSQALEAMEVDTPGGRVHVQWDHGSSATPNAQLAFFAEFLATTGVYPRFSINPLKAGDWRRI